MKQRKFILYSLCIIAMCLMGMGSNNSDVECKLDVELEAGECKLILKIFNPTAEEICLHFPSGQQYDYIVKNPQGEDIWQWSEGKAFIYMQLLQQLFISPGQEETFPATWTYIDKTGNPIQPGTYRVQGILTTTPDPIKTEWKEIDIPTSYIPEKPPIKGRITKILDKLYFMGEDGIAYHIENPSEDLFQLQNKQIEVTSYKAEPIPGTIDRKIVIEKYAIKTDSPFHNSSNP